MGLAQVIYLLIRHIISPVVVLGVQLNSRLSKRWEFESRNRSGRDAFEISFLNSHQKAQRCYHVSSEGEWEQAWPFVLEDLREGLKTEVLYTSESLEKRVQQAKLGLESDSIRFWRLPLLRHERLEDWVSARDLVMCRYDFFPSLIFLGLRLQQSGGRFCLLSASLKSKRGMLMREGAWPYVFWSWLYSRFERICLASGREKERFIQLGIEPRALWSYEARGLQILWRLKNYQHTLEQNHLDFLREAIEQAQPRSERLIFGSAWISDLQVIQQTLRHSPKRPLILIAPHDLSPQNIEQMKNTLQKDAQVFICDKKTGFEALSKALAKREVILFTERGVLLELYPLFGHAYVGGGFGRSIHSVLEPFLAGARIYCGPRTHRSSEVDMIEFERPELLKVLETPESAVELEASEDIAKGATPAYYERLYQKEREKLKSARHFLFEAQR